MLQAPPYSHNSGPKEWIASLDLDSMRCEHELALFVRASKCMSSTLPGLPDELNKGELLKGGHGERAGGSEYGVLQRGIMRRWIVTEP